MVGYAILFLTARRGIVELRSAAGNQGTAFGLFGLVSDIGNVAGPVVGVVLYELTGRMSFLVLGALSGLLVVVVTSQAARWRRSFPSGHQPPPLSPPVLLELDPPSPPELDEPLSPPELLELPPSPEAEEPLSELVEPPP
jgi:hypothetical protein